MIAKLEIPDGGPTGDALADLLTDSGVPFHRVKIGGRTREGCQLLRVEWSVVVGGVL